MGDEEPPDDTAVEKLLALLASLEPTPIPSTSLGRLGRTVRTAVRTAGAAGLARLGGRSTLDDAAVQRLVVALGELKGIAMKAGQILSYVDAPIPENVRRQLEVLQAQSPRTPFEIIERIVREDLGEERAATLLATLERVPASSASIGQVHRGTLPGGTQVAVKVLHPGIEEALRADFRGAKVGKALVKVLVPGADISEILEEAERTLLDECDYVREASFQVRFAELYEGDEDIIVPAVQGDFCGKRVLTTTWQDGVSLERFKREAPPEAIERAATTLFRFFVGTFYRAGFFNADPHPGNLLFRDDGHVVFLDYGCVRAFRPSVVHGMARLSEAVRRGDDDATFAVLGELGARFPTRPREKDREAAIALARSFFGPVIAPGRRVIEVGLGATVQELIEHKRALLRLGLPGELIFLVRIRFGVYSVLARLGAPLDWRRLEEEASSFAARSP